MKDKFNTYCLQQWAAYVEQKGTLSYKEYLKINKTLLKEQFYDRSEDQCDEAPVQR